MADDDARNVDARRAQGVQSGDHNVQFNIGDHGGDRVTDVSFLVGVDPSAAAGYLLRMPSGDATHRLSQMSVKQVVPILRVLLEEDDDGTALTLELLNLVHEDRRTGICRVLSRAAPWIAHFPDARNAILACRRTMVGRSNPGEAKIDRSTTSSRGTAGFMMACAGGMILWSDHFGAHVVSGALLEHHIAAGGSGGRLGFPTGGASTVASVGVTVQGFEGSPVTGAVTGCASAHGTFAIPAPVAAHLALYPDPYAILGAPVSEARRAGPSRWGTTGIAQHFERGLVVAVHGRPALRVAGRLLRLHEQLGGFTGEFGFPLAGALRTVTGQPGGALRGHGYQLFEGHRVLPVAVQEFARDTGLPAGGAIGVDPDGGEAALPVSGPIWEAYCDAGGFEGWLGFPVAAALPRAGRASQVFQGGAVLWSEAHGAYTVSGVIWDRIGGDAGLDEVGWPVAGQAPFPGDPSAIQQEFERALATVRDGTAKLWRS